MEDTKACAVPVESSTTQKMNHLDVVTKQVYDAIHLLPDDRKASIMKAMEKCPEILQNECDIQRFVRYAENNFWKAAEHAANY